MLLCGRVVAVLCHNPQGFLSTETCSKPLKRASELIKRKKCPEKRWGKRRIVMPRRGGKGSEDTLRFVLGMAFSAGGAFYRNKMSYPEVVYTLVVLPRRQRLQY
jgi:hypothetical protein